MADAPAPLASAVIVPDTTEGPIPSPTAIKRRQSSTSENYPKRPRLSYDDSKSGNDARSTPLEDNNERPGSGRKSINQLEERKRGQRLFGALLGTLSQSSSSTAQKRRKDIEQKQTAKLQHEADEFDEKKKQRLEVLTNFRRREQKVYDLQSMNIRHSNLLAQAHFLQTKAEPRLYYKPWELRESEEDTIKFQIAEAEAVIEKERQAAKAKEESLDESKPNDTDSKDTEMREGPNEEPINMQEEKVGSNTNRIQSTRKDDEGSREREKDHTPAEEPVAAAGENPTEKMPEDAKDQGDDQGDLVEGDEDAVIY